ncbi:MAG: amidohydrolase family protein [Micrococcaceae bacterium]
MKKLYLNAVIHSIEMPDATAMLVEDDKIAWLGNSEIAKTFIDDQLEVFDCEDKYIITPGFVDSHAHITEAGVVIDSIDLSNCKNAREVLDKVATVKGKKKIIGHSWDEEQWEDSRFPSLGELENAGNGADVYLARVDLHSALISSGLAAKISAAKYPGWDNTSHVTNQANEKVRDYIRSYTPAERKNYQKHSFKAAASNGIVAIGEMNGLHEGTVADLDILFSHENSPEILLYWAQLMESPEQVKEFLTEHNKYNIRGLAGDLNIDGSVGSRTAFLQEDYTDAKTKGSKYLDRDQVAKHLIATTLAGVQGGFHIIGDAAMLEAIEGAKLAAKEVGKDRFIAAMHRFEHAEMVASEHFKVFKDLNITASMQPTFDAWWGSEGGLYETRLGERSAQMNQLATFMDNGVLLAFGSDTPVTPYNPWRTVAAALFHHNVAERISARAAFNAHTKSGWRAAKEPNPMRGVIAVGAPADFAVWECDELAIQTVDETTGAKEFGSWSADEQARTPILPMVTDSEVQDIQCVETVLAGNLLHSRS